MRPAKALPLIFQSLSIMLVHTTDLTNSWTLLFNALPYPTCVVRRGIITDANPAMQRLLEADVMELTGCELRNVLKISPANVYEKIERLAKGHASVSSMIGGAPVFYNCRWVSMQSSSPAPRIVMLEPGMNMIPTALEKDLYDDLQQHRTLVGSMLETDELERKKLSDFLHDEVGSLLATARHQLDIVNNALQQQSEEVHQELNKSVSLVDESIRQLRKVAMQTAPVSLEFGLNNAIQFLTDSFHKKAGIAIQVIMLPEEMQLARGLEVIVYRIVQELLNNAVSHSSASEIILQIIKHTSSITITLEDNGKGFDYKREHEKKNTVGLKKIMQRVELFEGKMHVDSTPGNGTIITVELNVN